MKLLLLLTFLLSYSSSFARSVIIDSNINDFNLSGYKIYAFSGTTYLGVNGTVGVDGLLSLEVPDQEVRFRVDYAGQHYSPSSTSSNVAIDFIRPVTINSNVGSNNLAGKKVYVFQGTSYKSINKSFGEDGLATIYLPDDNYRYRVDYAGQTFTSESNSTNIQLDFLHEVTLNSNDGDFNLENYRAYVFNGDKYQGLNARFDTQGLIKFFLPNKEYRYRIDYAGKHFSETTSSATVLINHTREVTISAPNDKDLLVNKRVYVFNDLDKYQGLWTKFDANGLAKFQLPNANYKYRVDFRGKWFTPLSDQTTIDASLSTFGFRDVLVDGSADKEDLVNKRVYVFDASNKYQGIWKSFDANGHATFYLANEDYKYRVDYRSQWFTSVSSATTVNASLASFGFRDVVVDFSQDKERLGSARVYVFDENDKYQGVWASLDVNGQAHFNLPTQNYKYRLDYKGQWFTPLSDSALVVSSLSAFGFRDVLINASLDKAHLASKRVYVFDENDKYQSEWASFDQNGQATFFLSSKNYKYRVDFRGQWFTPVSNSSVVNVSLASFGFRDVMVGGSANKDLIAGKRVYVFSDQDIYEHIYKTLDANAQTSFYLPNRSFKYRLDFRGKWYTQATDQTLVDISLSTFGFRDVLIDGSADKERLAGKRVYVFDGNNKYIGVNKTFDANGQATFLLANQAYKYRVDFQGQYFTALSDATTIDASLFSFGFRDVVLSAGVDKDILENKRVYVFDENDKYQGVWTTFDDQGLATFNLADKNYKFRVDYIGKWFTPVTNQTAVDASLVSFGFRNVTINSNVGSNNLANYRTYVFDENNKYVGLWEKFDAQGIASFYLPNEIYKYRVDYAGQTFTPATNQTTVQLDFLHEVTLDSNDGDFNLAGYRTYVFDGDTYQSLNTTFDAQGLAKFFLPNKAYRYRIDYSGQHFTQTTSDELVAVSLTREVTIDSNIGNYNLAGYRVYVYQGTEYKSLNATFDTSGLAKFQLPLGTYRYRVDYINQQYTQETDQNYITLTDYREVTVDSNQADGFNLQNYRTYVFQGTTYKGLNAKFDAQGLAKFLLPVDEFRYRVDYVGQTYTPQTSDTLVTLDFLHDVAINSNVGPNNLAGKRAYVFNENNQYQSINKTFNTSGFAYFKLPNKAYKYRIDYAGQTFTSVTSSEQIQLDFLHTVTLDSNNQGYNLANSRAYVFNGTSYQSINKTFNASGFAQFFLPQKEYRYRVDYAGQNYTLITSSNYIHLDNYREVVVDSNTDTGNLANTNVLVYKDAQYLSILKKFSSTDGLAKFYLPEDSFRYRVDFNGQQFSQMTSSVYVKFDKDTLNFEYEETQDAIDSTVNLVRADGFTIQNQIIKVYNTEGTLIDTQISDLSGSASFTLTNGLAFNFTYEFNQRIFESGFFISPNNKEITLPAYTQVQISNLPNLENHPISVLNENGESLNYTKITDSNGLAQFSLLSGNYQFKMNYYNEEYFSNIVENEESATINIPSQSVSFLGSTTIGIEKNFPELIPVHLARPASQLTIINVTASPGSNIQTSDYVMPISTITFQEGQDTAYVPIQFIQDFQTEVNEALNLQLSPVTAIALGGFSNLQINVHDKQIHEPIKINADFSYLNAYPESDVKIHVLDNFKTSLQSSFTTSHSSIQFELTTPELAYDVYFSVHYNGNRYLHSLSNVVASTNHAIIFNGEALTPNIVNIISTGSSLSEVTTIALLPTSLIPQPPSQTSVNIDSYVVYPTVLLDESFAYFPHADGDYQILLATNSSQIFLSETATFPLTDHRIYFSTPIEFDLVESIKPSESVTIFFYDIDYPQFTSVYHPDVDGKASFLTLRKKQYQFFLDRGLGFEESIFLRGGDIYNMVPLALVPPITTVGYISQTDPNLSDSLKMELYDESNFYSGYSQHTDTFNKASFEDVTGQFKIRVNKGGFNLQSQLYTFPSTPILLVFGNDITLNIKYKNENIENKKVNFFSYADPSYIQEASTDSFGNVTIPSQLFHLYGFQVEHNEQLVPLPPLSSGDSFFVDLFAFDPIPIIDTIVLLDSASNEDNEIIRLFDTNLVLSPIVANLNEQKIATLEDIEQNFYLALEDDSNYVLNSQISNMLSTDISTMILSEKVEVYIYNPQNHQNIEVQYLNLQIPSFIQSKVSDDTGRVTFKTVPDGVYKVRVNFDGAIEEKIVFPGQSVLFGKESSFNLNKNQVPLINIPVILLDESFNSTGIQSITSSTGKVKFTNVLGRYYLGLQINGQLVISGSYDFPVHNESITLGSEIQIETKLDGSNLSLQKIIYHNLRYPNFIQEIYTDQNGLAQIQNIATDTYFFTKDYPYSSREEIELSAGAVHSFNQQYYTNISVLRNGFKNEKELSFQLLNESLELIYDTDMISESSVLDLTGVYRIALLEDGKIVYGDLTHLLSNNDLTLELGHDIELVVENSEGKIPFQPVYYYDLNYPNLVIQSSVNAQGILTIPSLKNHQYIFKTNFLNQEVNSQIVMGGQQTKLFNNFSELNLVVNGLPLITPKTINLLDSSYQATTIVTQTQNSKALLQSSGEYFITVEHLGTSLLVPMKKSLPLTSPMFIDLEESTTINVFNSLNQTIPLTEVIYYETNNPSFEQSLFTDALGSITIPCVFDHSYIFKVQRSFGFQYSPEINCTQNYTFIEKKTTKVNLAINGSVITNIQLDLVSVDESTLITQAISNVSGDAYFQDLSGDYRIKVHLNNHTFLTQEVNLPQDLIQLSLSNIDIRIVDANDQAIAAKEILLERLDDGSIVSTGFTNQQGNLSLHLLESENYLAKYNSDFGENISSKLQANTTYTFKEFTSLIYLSENNIDISTITSMSLLNSDGEKEHDFLVNPSKTLVGFEGSYSIATYLSDGGVLHTDSYLLPQDISLNVVTVQVHVQEPSSIVNSVYYPAGKPHLSQLLTFDSFGTSHIKVYDHMSYTVELNRSSGKQVKTIENQENITFLPASSSFIHLLENGLNLNQLKEIILYKSSNEITSYTANIGEGSIAEFYTTSGAYRIGLNQNGINILSKPYSFPLTSLLTINIGSFELNAINHNSSIYDKTISIWSEENPSNKYEVQLNGESYIFPTLNDEKYDLSLLRDFYEQHAQGIKNQDKVLLKDEYTNVKLIKQNQVLTELVQFINVDKEVTFSQMASVVTSIAGDYFLNFTHNNFNYKSSLKSFPSTTKSLNLTSTQVTINHQSSLINNEVSFYHQDWFEEKSSLLIDGNNTLYLDTLIDEKYNLSIGDKSYEVTGGTGSFINDLEENIVFVTNGNNPLGSNVQVSLLNDDLYTTQSKLSDSSSEVMFLNLHNNYRIKIVHGNNEYITKVLSFPNAYTIIDIGDVNNLEGNDLFAAPIIESTNFDLVNVSYEQNIILKGTITNPTGAKLSFRNENVNIINNTFEIPIALDVGLNQIVLKLSKPTTAPSSYTIDIQFKNYCPGTDTGVIIQGSNFESQTEALTVSLDGHINNLKIQNTRSNIIYDGQQTNLTDFNFNDVSLLVGRQNLSILFQPSFQTRVCKLTNSVVANNTSTANVVVIENKNLKFTPISTPYQSNLKYPSLVFQTDQHTKVDITVTSNEVGSPGKIWYRSSYYKELPGMYEIELWKPDLTKLPPMAKYIINVEFEDKLDNIQTHKFTASIVY